MENKSFFSKSGRAALEGPEGYLPIVTENLSSRDFRILSPDEYDMGQTKKRHGGILQITDEEYEKLLLCCK